MSLPDFHAEPFVAAAVTLAIVVLAVVGLMRAAGLRRPSGDLLSDESRDDDLHDWPGAVAAVAEPQWPGEDVEREAYERSLRPVVDEPTDTETARIHAAVRDYDDAGADRLLRALGEDGQR